MDRRRRSVSTRMPTQSRMLAGGAALVVLAVLVLAGCAGDDDGGAAPGPSTQAPSAGTPAASPSRSAPPATIALRSPAFRNNGMIPVRYSCRGDDVSPPLRWSGVPRQARALALVLEDVDGDRVMLVHWVVVNIAPGTSGVAAGQVPRGGVQYGSPGGQAYFGPCPPAGTRTYRFTLYALPAPWLPPPEQRKIDVVETLHQQALAMGRLTGRFAAAG